MKTKYDKMREKHENYIQNTAGAGPGPEGWPCWCGDLRFFLLCVLTLSFSPLALSTPAFPEKNKYGRMAGAGAAAKGGGQWWGAFVFVPYFLAEHTFLVSGGLLWQNAGNMRKRREKIQ